MQPRERRMRHARSCLTPRVHRVPDHDEIVRLYGPWRLAHAARRCCAVRGVRRSVVDRGRLGHRGVHRRPAPARRRGPEHPAVGRRGAARAPGGAPRRLAGGRRRPQPDGRRWTAALGHLREPVVAPERRGPVGVRRHPDARHVDDLDLQARRPDQPPAAGDPVGARRHHLPPSGGPAPPQGERAPGQGPGRLRRLRAAPRRRVADLVAGCPGHGPPGPSVAC